MNLSAKPELIAPAGSPEKLQYAFAYGADAVYAGIPEYSLRARTNAFEMKSLLSAISEAHRQEKRLYVTFNIFAHNHQVEALSDYIQALKDQPPDAIVISDPGMLRTILKIGIKSPIHLSTQANCTNWQAAQFWSEQGIKRIILARELTLDEIAQIHERVPEIELECFVHGAMCISYSGRCLLSRYLVNRSANLGDCAQPCRWIFKLFEADYQLEERVRPGKFLPIAEEENGTFILSSRDLCLIDYLENLRAAGVYHFKIEGRAKSIYYLCAIVRAYRTMIDFLGTAPSADEIFKKRNTLHQELAKVVNRGYTTGFLFDLERRTESQLGIIEKTAYEFVGEVLSGFDASKQALIKVHNVLRKGEPVEVLEPGGASYTLIIEAIRDPNTQKELIEAHGGTNKNFAIQVAVPLKKYSLLRRIVSSKRNSDEGK